MMLKNLKYMSGFNLFELVMVMGIVAILATIGIPSFKYVTTSNRISSEVNSLVGDMQYARSEAIKEGQTVTICASANPTPTVATCSASTSWASGWIVFSDPNKNQTVDAGEPILRVQSAFTGTDTFVATQTAQAVMFNRAGFPSAGPVGAMSFLNAVLFVLHVSPNDAQWTRCVALNTVNNATNTGVGLLATEKSGTGGCL
jgi:type IV fimbrial biogenesis protein FimT